jgi:membrane protein
MSGTKHPWTKYLAQLYVRFRDDDLPAMSAQLTFYLLLSLFPFLLFLLNILSLTSVPIQSYTDRIIEFLPNDVAQFYRDFVSEMLGVKSAALLSVSAIITVWSASRGVQAIGKCLNKACDANEDRPFLKLTAITVFFTLCMVVLVLITLLFMIFGRVIGQNLFGLIHAEQVFLKLWNVLRYAVPIIGMFFVFFLLYKIIPNCRLARRDVLPGALFSTAGWIITSLVFAFYINHFTSYTRIYGSIGAVIILLIWLYLSSIVLLLGGEINATLSYFRTGTKIDKYENIQIKWPFPLSHKKNLKKRESKNKPPGS